MFEDEVMKILERWLNDCKIYFFYSPSTFAYHCEVRYEKYNIRYKTIIPYDRELDAKQVTHKLLSDMNSYILKHFIKED